jgi:Plavaka transposase
MLTKHAFRALEQHKGTLWLRVAPTFLHVLETATVSVVGALLDGSRLYVYPRISPLLLNVFQVKDTPKEKNKPEFTTLKRRVWHQSFLVIIRSIAALSKTGCWLECGDGVKRWLFPTVLILSADYEEQYVISYS